MVSAFTVLHISDLHLSSTHQHDQEIVIEAFLEDLRRFPTANIPLPDIAIFSGDLAKAGKDQQAFHTAATLLLRPMLEILRLPPERLIPCPGNHDVNLEKIDQYYDLGLTNALTSRDATNTFISSADLSHLLDRFRNYQTFVDAFLPPPHSRGDLWTAHRFHLGSLDIGVVSLNSAWRATGRPDDADRLHLLVSERQIDDALTALEGCSIRVAVMHHPWEWLQPFDQRDVRGRLLSAFHLVLLGHTHDADQSLLHAVQGTCFISRAGCLYQTRKYFNGYSVISYGADSSITVYAREYYDDRRAFDACVRLAPGGVISFPPYNVPAPPSSLPASHLASTVADYSRTFETQANDLLLSSLTGSLAPGELRRVFIEPPLSPEPESSAVVSRSDSHTDPSRYLTLADLLRSTDNLLFLGPKEAGKSTLLHRVVLHFLDAPLPSLALPLYMTFKDSRGFTLEKLLRDLANDAFTVRELRVLLTEGRCVVVLDDLPADSSVALDTIRQLTTTYPNNRYICAASEELLLSLGVEKLSIGIVYTKVHIHSLNRPRIRRLASTWFGTRFGDIERPLEDVLTQMRRLAIPRTPFLLSLIFWILETQNTLVLLNHASLIQKFFESVLDKLHPADGLRDAIDFRIKEHFLAHLAGVMVARNKYALSRFELEALAIAYFERKGFGTKISGFIDYFLTRGVLHEHGGTIRFKYRCFGEYFIACQMMEDRAFYDLITAPDKYLDFPNEIDYFTGLRRDDLAIVLTLEKRVDDLLSSVGLDADLALFEQIAVGESPLTEEGRRELLQRLREPPVEERDGVLDRADRSGGMDQSMTRSRELNPFISALDALRIWSFTIRNGELIDDVVTKKRVVEKALRQWSRLMTALLLVAEELSDENWAQEEAESTREPGKGASRRLRGMTKERFTYYFKVLIPLGMHGIVRDSLATGKLEASFAAVAESREAETPLRLVAAMILTDLRKDGYWDVVRTVMEDVADHRLSLETLFHKLHLNYLFRPLGTVERKKTEALIGDIFLRLERSGQKTVDHARRSAFLQELEKKLILYSGM